jgi:hypothetical protein
MFRNCADNPFVSISNLDKDTLYYRVNDHRSLFNRMTGIIHACFSHFVHTIHRVRRIIKTDKEIQKQYIFPIYSKENKCYSYDFSKLPWSEKQTFESEGLCLFVHGLRNHPRTWNTYLAHMAKNHPKIQCVAPLVSLRGNCSLEEASKPILSIVEDYLKKNPGKTVNFFGTSNGVRIIEYCETHLDPSLLQNSSLNFISISGVIGGTKVVNILKKMKLLFFSGLNPSLKNEFQWHSHVSQDLHHHWQKKQTVWQQNNVKVKHIFYATMEDHLVRPISSCFPDLDDKRKEYHVFMGESHSSIVDRVFNDVITRVKFLRKSYRVHRSSN